MVDGCQIVATNSQALFTLKLHRGDGMTLLAMNWKQGTPPLDFVGFALEYKEPGGDRYWSIKNRISFAPTAATGSQARTSSRLSPIQKFRWVHFPRYAEKVGPFTYRVTPVFMNEAGELSYGEAQEAAIVLARQTYPHQLNVAFTRGFVSSQAFVERYVTAKDGLGTLIPAKAEEGLEFVPTHPEKTEALAWMGFEARSAILELLDGAIADSSAQVRVVAYDLNDPAIVSRLELLKQRLRIIIDNSADHGPPSAAESKAARRLALSAGDHQVKRQKMGNLQHNKTIVAEGKTLNAAICGSTNFSWRGQFVQANNALVVHGKKAIQPFIDAFEAYWQHDSVKQFAKTSASGWQSLGLSDIDAKVSFSPHSKEGGVLKSVANDILSTTSSLFYSLAFLNQTSGPVTDAIKAITLKEGIFVYGISDKKVGGLDVQLPSGKMAPVYPANLSQHLPEPFKSEPSAGGGIRMHHKFVVIDPDQPTARVYLGSYNFSGPADLENGENLLLIKDRRVAVSYMVEALTLFDHYHFRVVQANAQDSGQPIHLKTPPKAGEKPWWDEDYTDPRKINDRQLFA